MFVMLYFLSFQQFQEPYLFDQWLSDERVPFRCHQPDGAPIRRFVVAHGRLMVKKFAAIC